MRILVHKVIFFILLALAVFHSAGLQAQEMQAMKANPEEEDNFSGGFLRVGLGYKARINPYEDEEKGADFFINGRYQWQLGFFVEAAYYRVLNEGVRIGYNFYNTDHWNFDVHNVVAHGAINVEIDYLDQHLQKKIEQTQMLAVRATGSYGKNTMQFMFAPYSLNENTTGIYASASIDRSFQLKNWQIYGSLGLEFRSKELLHHYYGYHKIGTWTSVYFPAYRPGSGIDVTGEIGVSYPISKNMLLEVYHKYTDLADSINNSPFFQYSSTRTGRSKNVSESGILISYTF